MTVEETVALVRNLRSCLRAMSREVTALRRERTASLILHRWQSTVWASKFRRMTSVGRREHRAQALVLLSRCADDWKRRCLAWALGFWYRRTSRLRAMDDLARRRSRRLQRTAVERAFSSWRSQCWEAKEEARVLRNFVLRWKQLDLARYFRHWHARATRAAHVRRGVNRLSRRFLYRCFNFWHALASDLHGRRAVAEAKGKARRFSMLYDNMQYWAAWAERERRNREACLTMGARRQRRTCRKAVYAWLVYATMGNARGPWATISSSSSSSSSGKLLRDHGHRAREQLRRLGYAVLDGVDGFEDRSSIEITKALSLGFGALAMKGMARSRTRTLRFFFSVWRRFAEHAVILRYGRAGVQARRSARFFERSAGRVRLFFVIRGWKAAVRVLRAEKKAAAKMRAVALARRAGQLLLRWRDWAAKAVANRGVLATFVARMRNRGVAMTFNTWADNAAWAAWTRECVALAREQAQTRMLRVALRKWSVVAREQARVRRSVSSIEQYVLLQRTVSGWRFFTQRSCTLRRAAAVLQHHRAWRQKR